MRLYSRIVEHLVITIKGHGRQLDHYA